jgi:hypothetical protein
MSTEILEANYNKNHPYLYKHYRVYKLDYDPCWWKSRFWLRTGTKHVAASTRLIGPLDNWIANGSTETNKYNYL